MVPYQLKVRERMIIEGKLLVETYLHVLKSMAEMHDLDMFTAMPTQQQNLPTFSTIVCMAGMASGPSVCRLVSSTNPLTSEHQIFLGLEDLFASPHPPPEKAYSSISKGVANLVPCPSVQSAQ